MYFCNGFSVYFLYFFISLLYFLLIRQLIETDDTYYSVFILLASCIFLKNIFNWIFSVKLPVKHNSHDSRWCLFCLSAWLLSDTVENTSNTKNRVLQNNEIVEEYDPVSSCRSGSGGWLTWGIGQQPYVLLAIWQQVVWSGQADLSGHLTVSTRSQKTRSEQSFVKEYFTQKFKFNHCLLTAAPSSRDRVAANGESFNTNSKPEVLTNTHTDWPEFMSLNALPYG